MSTQRLEKFYRHPDIQRRTAWFCIWSRRAIHYYVRTYAKISVVRKFGDFSYVLFTIDS